MENQVAMTVQGPIPASELGPTLMHEHILNDCSCWWEGHDPEYNSPIRDVKVNESIHGELLKDPFGCLDNCGNDDEELACCELRDVVDFGCRTIVDPTTRGIGRDPKALLRIADKTGLNIVVGSGYYLQSSHPTDLRDKSTEEIAEELEHEFRYGVDGTDIRIGLIGEIGVGSEFTTDEKKSLEGAISGAVRTGLPLMVHLPGWDRYGHQVLDMCDAGGLDSRRVILCHMNPSCNDQSYQLSLAMRGAFIEYDMIGMEYTFENGRGICPTDEDSALGILNLCNEGYENRILLSQDVFLKSMLTKYGGKGYATLFRDFLPTLRSHGMTQSEIDNLLIANPARALAIHTGRNQ